MTTALSPRSRRLVRWAALPVAVLASGVIVSTASYAAFTSSTDNSGNAWSAGAIALSDDDSGAAMFAADDLQPGSTGVNCIAVTSDGSLSSDIRLYADNAAQTQDLDQHLQLDIVQGAGGGYGSCEDFVPATTGASVYGGTLAGLANTAVDHASGLGSWASVGGGEERVFKVTYTLSPDAPNTVQGGTAAVDLVWEGRTS
ncbi:MULTISPECIES: hypothetical protein [unclassified Plantibacter]|uniref:hypothetical protein n=1 Tax=unclassified Plantibacter TaxID=2624265 RepID=UPI001780CAE2|nr:hypothetical protein [Plantibacter sp. CFBP 8804]MBD8517627.1 hypothetical protein [Plantibacter sp. CFBP 8804]